MCVQRFDDSLNSAIHITYRISLRSSSMPEPRDPLLKVLGYFHSLYSDFNRYFKVLNFLAIGEQNSSTNESQWGEINRIYFPRLAKATIGIISKGWRGLSLKNPPKEKL